MSEPVVITDWDECAVGEGPALALQGHGLAPYPETPPPAPRPASTGGRARG